MHEEQNYKERIQQMLGETEDVEVLCFVYTVLKKLLK